MTTRVCFLMQVRPDQNVQRLTEYFHLV